MTTRAKSNVHIPVVLALCTCSVRDDGRFFRARGATRGSRRHSTWYQLTVLRPPMPQRASNGKHRCSRPWNLKTNIMSCFLLNATKSSNASLSPTFTFCVEIPFAGDFLSSFALLWAAAADAGTGDGCTAVFKCLVPGSEEAASTSVSVLRFFLRIVRRIPRDGSLTVSFTLMSPRSAHPLDTDDDRSDLTSTTDPRSDSVLRGAGSRNCCSNCSPDWPAVLSTHTTDGCGTAGVALKQLYMAGSRTDSASP